MAAGCCWAAGFEAGYAPAAAADAQPIQQASCTGAFSVTGVRVCAYPSVLPPSTTINSAAAGCSCLSCSRVATMLAASLRTCQQHRQHNMPAEGRRVAACARSVQATDATLLQWIICEHRCCMLAQLLMRQARVMRQLLMPICSCCCRCLAMQTTKRQRPRFQHALLLQLTGIMMATRAEEVSMGGKPASRRQGWYRASSM